MFWLAVVMEVLLLEMSFKYTINNGNELV